MAEATVYDALIIGGGPGGSTAARRLAAEGWRVLLLERHQQVGRKACGGGLTDKALRLLGPEVEPLLRDHCRTVRVTVGRRAGGYSYNHTLMATVHRAEFDPWLLQAASQAGADIRQGVTVRRVERGGDHWLATAAGQTYAARHIIGADGVRSRVGKALGLSNPIREQAFALALDLYADADAAQRWQGIAELDFSLTHGGFGWVFPKGEVLATGIGVPYPLAPKLPQMLREYLRGLGLEGLPPVQPLRGAFIPRGTPLPAYQRAGCLLVGDAAGLADPLTGEGICLALRSGELAAEAVSRALRGETGALEDYEAAVRAELLPELGAAREVADLVFGFWGRPWRKLLTTDRALRVMAALTTGQRSYESVLTAVVERTPFGLWRRWRRRMRRGPKQIADCETQQRSPEETI